MPSGAAQPAPSGPPGEVSFLAEEVPGVTDLVRPASPPQARLRGEVAEVAEGPIAPHGVLGDQHRQPATPAAVSSRGRPCGCRYVAGAQVPNRSSLRRSRRCTSTSSPRTNRRGSGTPTASSARAEKSAPLNRLATLRHQDVGAELGATTDPSQPSAQREREPVGVVLVHDQRRDDVELVVGRTGEQPAQGPRRSREPVVVGEPHPVGAERARGQHAVRVAAGTAEVGLDWSATCAGSPSQRAMPLRLVPSPLSTTTRWSGRRCWAATALRQRRRSSARSHVTMTHTTSGAAGPAAGSSRRGTLGAGWPQRQAPGERRVHRVVTTRRPNRVLGRRSTSGTRRVHRPVDRGCLASLHVSTPSPCSCPCTAATAPTTWPGLSRAPSTSSWSDPQRSWSSRTARSGRSWPQRSSGSSPPARCRCGGCGSSATSVWPRRCSAGLSACSHEVVARMDADDISLPHRFAVQLPLIEAGADLVGAGMREFGETTPTGGLLRIPPTDPTHIASEARLRSPFNHPTVVYRRSAVLQAGGYRELPLLEDYWLFTRMIEAGSVVANVPGTAGPLPGRRGFLPASWRSAAAALRAGPAAAAAPGGVHHLRSDAAQRRRARRLPRDTGWLADLGVPQQVHPVRRQLR